MCYLITYNYCNYLNNVLWKKYNWIIFRTHALNIFGKVQVADAKTDYEYSLKT